MIYISTKECYKTVASCGEAFLVEKKSKFIATVRPVACEQDALAFLQEMRSKFSDATHNVYAYVIDENNIFRYSDDGEPGGTAGMPVLDTIRKEGIVDVAIVVTRYFGGTLLGTGGLVHAYGAAARMGLESANIVTRILCDIVSCKVDYTLIGKMQHMIATEGYIVEDTIYDSEVEFVVCLRAEEVEKFCNAAVELSCGRANINNIDKKYIDVK